MRIWLQFFLDFMVNGGGTREDMQIESATTTAAGDHARTPRPNPCDSDLGCRDVYAADSAPDRLVTACWLVLRRAAGVFCARTAPVKIALTCVILRSETELETQSLRKVISQRYKVRMEDVDVARVVPVGSDGQTLYEVGFRVRGSPLTASEQQDAAQASSLLEEANKEMAPSPPIHVVGPPKNPSASPPQNSTTQEPKRPVPEKSKPQDTNDFFAK